MSQKNNDYSKLSWFCWIPRDFSTFSKRLLFSEISNYFMKCLKIKRFLKINDISRKEWQRQSAIAAAPSGPISNTSGPISGNFDFGLVLRTLRRTLDSRAVLELRRTLDSRAVLETLWCFVLKTPYAIGVSQTVGRGVGGKTTFGNDNGLRKYVSGTHFGMGRQYWFFRYLILTGAYFQ